MRPISSSDRPCSSGGSNSATRRSLGGTARPASTPTRSSGSKGSLSTRAAVSAEGGAERAPLGGAVEGGGWAGGGRTQGGGGPGGGRGPEPKGGGGRSRPGARS